MGTLGMTALATAITLPSAMGLALEAPTLGTAEFTRTFAEAITQSHVFQAVRIVDDLWIKADLANGYTLDCRLAQAYKQYQAEPESLQALVARHILALKESAQPSNLVRIERMVPLVRNVSYVTRDDQIA